MMGISTAEVKKIGRRIGFDLIGIASADPVPEYAETVRTRIEGRLIPPESQKAEDNFRRPNLYSDPRNSLPQAKCVVSVGIRYLIDDSRDNTKPGMPCGVIARQSWRDFYGQLWKMKARLINHMHRKGVRCSKQAYLPHKLVAQRAGVGWYGKNCLIQTEAYGSWVIVASVVTDAKLDIDEPISRDCGSCQACIKACPTQAIVAPYTLNIGRCVNHLAATSSHIPEEIRPLMGNRINGCDRCQEVCPNNREIPPVRKRFPNPRRKWGTSPPLIRLAGISAGEFKKSFSDLDWYKPRLECLQRNIAVALGNIGDPVAIPTLKRMLSHPEVTVRSHAAWALGRIGS